MSTAITWNGVAYSVPASGEVGWASLSNFLIALGNSAQATTFQKVGTRIATTSPVTVVAATDCTVITNLAVAGAVAVNLPAGVDGQFFAIVDGKGDAATNNITITPFGAETINGAANLVINSARGAAIFVFKTGNWSVISRPSVTLPSGAVTQDAVALWNSDGSLRNSKLAVDDTGATAATLTTFDINQTANRTVTIQDATQTLIGRDTTDQGANRLTNKDLDDATTKVVDSSDTTKKLGFDVSGTAGTTQTLATSQTANRTLTLPDATDTLVGKATTDQLTNKDYEGGTASNTSRITVPKASTSTLNALTRKQSTIVYDTSLNQLKVDDGTNLQAIGGGSGELTFVTNPNDAGNWSTTGANGPTGATTSTAGDLPLSNFTTAIQLTSATAAGAEASNYFSYSFTTGASYAVKTKIEFWLRTGSNFLSNEWTVSVYQGATRVALTTDSSGVTYIPAANGKFTTYFDALASTAYTVRFSRPVNAGTNAAVLNIANVIVGPGIQPQGAVVSSLGNIGATTNGFGTIANSSFKGWRIGNLLKVQASFQSGTPSASPAAIVLPTGMTVDTSILSSNQDSLVGLFARSATGAAQAFFNGNSGAMFYDISAADTSRINFSPNLNGSQDGTFTAFNGNSIFSASDGVIVEFTVPIAQWAGSGTVNLAQNDVEYAFNTTAFGTANTSAFGYGPNGAAFGSSPANEFAQRVRFQTPIQVTDKILIEVDPLNSGVWFPALGAHPTGSNKGSIVDYNHFGSPSTTNAFGLAYLAVSGSRTDIDVLFGRYYYTTTDNAASGDWSDWSANGARWRVKKSSGGQAVGFGMATATSSGLVTLPNAMTRVVGGTGGNTTGTTGTTTRVFGSTTSTTGAGVTYVSSATNGDSFTINENGVYAITYSDRASTVGREYGVTVNNPSTTAISSATAAARLLYGNVQVADRPTPLSGTFRLSAGDVIRAQTDGLSNFVNSSGAIDLYFVITQVAKL